MATDILVPELGESVTEGTVASWLKKPGDAVAVDENLLELETDKVTLEVPSPVAGTLLEALVEEGATVEVGAILARVAEGEGAASAPAAAPAAATSAAAAPAAAPAVPNAATAAATPPPAASQSGNGAAAVANGQASGPTVTKMLAEAPHIDPASLSASGRNGRLTKGDVQTALLQPSPASPAASNSSREERVPLSRLRQSIARNLKQAQNTAAILTTYNEVDMTAVMALRKAHQEAFVDRYGFKLGFMSFFVKATVAALKQLPAVNAEIDGNEIVYKNYANIGVAVGTEARPSGAGDTRCGSAILCANRSGDQRFWQSRPRRKSILLRCRAAPSPSPTVVCTARLCQRLFSTRLSPVFWACTKSRSVRWWSRILWCGL